MSIAVSHEKGEQGNVQILPLSPAQERLLLLDQLKTNTTLTTLSISIKISHIEIHARLLETALNRLVQRHEALRATFQEKDGQPLQVIAPTMTISLPVIDLQALPAAEQVAEIVRLETEEAQKPFDLFRGPLVRASLLRLKIDEHVLLLNLHQIICDRWSAGVCIRELTSLYDALASDLPYTGAEPSLSYADVVQQEQAWLESDAAGEQLVYWKRQLAGLPASLDLPTDRPRMPEPTLRKASYHVAVPQRLSEAVRTLGQREQVSLDTVLVAALQTLLYRYTEQEDVVIGTVTTGRSAKNEAMVGCFENTLALRSHLSGDLSFRSLLSQAGETIQQARQHQQLPFASLLKELPQERAADLRSFFQVMLTLTPPSIALPPAWSVARMVVGAGTSLSDLHLTIEERAEGLLAHFEYSTDLFDEATIARMAGHWQMVLEGVVANPEQPLSALPLLTERERHQLLIEWNTPEVEYFQGRCVHELFEMQVERTPDAVAVVCEGRQLRYDELNRRANQLARYLRQSGVRPEVAVGICVERSLEMVVGLLGILKAGGVHVPLDVAAPAERLAFMVQETEMPIMVTQQHLLAKFTETHPQFVCLDSDRAALEQQPASNPTHTVTGEHLAYIIYTSGSTGQPKGVQIEHRSLVAHCEALSQAQGLSAADCVLQFNSFSFDASLEQILPPLLVGARLVLRGPEIWSPVDLLCQVKEQQLTVASMPCDYWHAVLAQWVAQPEQLTGLRLRLMMAGGDRLPPEAVQLWRQSPLHATRFFNVYGPTEGTITTTIYDIPRHNEQPEINIPIGRPLPNRRVYILDKKGQPVPQGVAGELYIGGETVARGYLKRPELTAERFITDPFSKHPQARLYKTGDLVRYRAGGIIEFLGRVDKQIKIRGYRVELGEIETAIKQHPAVLQTTVIAHGEQNVKRLAAYIVPASPLSAQEGEQLLVQLRNELKERLPDYMIPGAFVLLEELPLNASGKIDQQALPQPDFTASEQQESFVAPRSSLEELVADSWKQALGIEQIGIHDNFFVLGGHSLLAMQIIARLQTLFQVAVPLQRFFEGPTVAQLAETITRLQATPAPSHRFMRRELVQEKDRQICPVSLTQEGLWFLQQLEPESVTYNIYVALRVQQSLDVTILERSLYALVQRHEMLRTTFGKRDGKAVQIIAASLTLPLSVHDLQDLPEAERDAEVRRLASASAQRPFDLARGPLLRASLFRLAPEESLLFLATHHIVADGWSLDVLLPELCSLYEAFANDQPSPLADLPFRYADFAHWQRDLMQEGQFAEQFAYWEQQLANLPDALELPMARPRSAQPTAEGSTHILTMSRTLTDAIKHLSR
ncbi:MAG TPA: amino acid adenylation domain-containing protein, partial [Ktedonobacteraceae bacterium]|nr:amino acid adenylation domain-containing protein [Ktedonobacteraceae bacterium]